MVAILSLTYVLSLVIFISQWESALYTYTQTLEQIRSFQLRPCTFRWCWITWKFSKLKLSKIITVQCQNFYCNSPTPPTAQWRGKKAFWTPNLSLCSSPVHTAHDREAVTIGKGGGKGGNCLLPPALIWVPLPHPMHNAAHMVLNPTF